MPSRAARSVPAVAPVQSGGSAGRVHLVRVVTAASVALALTAPGQTAAVSVFVDPLIADLGVSRSAVSTAYLLGTLSGVAVMPLLGRLIDRFGPRYLMAVVAAGFGAILVAASAVGEIVGLTAAFVGIRMGGQGALNLVATTTVACYVYRRRGLAVGLVSALGASGISLAPIALERLVAHWGWRAVWVAEGCAVCALVIPAALIVLPRHRPPRPDHLGGGADPARDALPAVDATVGQAMRSGMFWVVTSGVGVSALITTGLNFQQLSLLGESGLSPTQAAATFLPQTVAGLLAAFTLGWLADRHSDRILIISMMVVLAAGTLGAGWLTPGLTAILYGMALGACSNGIRTVEAVAFPRCFGVAHLGAIRGVVHAVTVGASAFGPVALAVGRDHATSYRPVLLALTVLPVAVIVAAALVHTPPPPLAPRSAAADRQDTTTKLRVRVR